MVPVIHTGESMENHHPPSKKVYQVPLLKEYGDLRALTMAVSNTTPSADGGTGMGTNKTA